jgi:hypothetical protein
VLPSTQLRDRLLELFYFGSEDKGLRIANTGNLVKNFLSQRNKLLLEVEKGYFGH